MLAQWRREVNQQRRADLPISFIELIQSYRESVSVCDVEEAARRIKQEVGLLVIDVRETAEFESASLPFAVNVPRGFLEFKIATVCEEADAPILLHCKTGGRAILAAKTLAEMGYSNVGVVGGTVEDLLAAVG